MVKKTFKRILLLGFGIILVMSLISITIFHINYEKQAKNNLKTIACIVSNELNYNNDYSFIKEKSFNATRLTIIDENGTVLADSTEDAKNMENHSNRPEFKEAKETGQGSTIRKSTTQNQNTYYYATLLDNGHILRVAVTSSSALSAFYQGLICIVVIAVLVMLLSFVISLAITKSIVKPITEIGKNLDNINQQETLEELKPFVNTLKEHEKKRKLLDKQKKQFTENISHELKTPLTSIAGYAELIESGIAKEQDIKPFAGTIRQQALRLVALAEDIIQLSQLDETKENDIVFEELNLKEISRVCISSLEMNTREKNISITLDAEDCIIDGNQALIEELVYNLLDNAIRYNKENGSIRVVIKRLFDESVLLSVEDTGIGIPEKYQGRIFERFFRVDKSRSKATGGTGLGLAIVKHIADVHNAEISVLSQEDKGTTIQVEFKNQHI